MVFSDTLMKIYNEKEQTEQGKSQNENFEKTRKCNEAKSRVQGNKGLRNRIQGWVA